MLNIHRTIAKLARARPVPGDEDYTAAVGLASDTDPDTIEASEPDPAPDIAEDWYGPLPTYEASDRPLDVSRRVQRRLIAHASPSVGGRSSTEAPAGWHAPFRNALAIGLYTRVGGAYRYR